MNIKKRITILSILATLSLIPALNVQAATADTNITSNIGWKNEDGSWYYYKSDYTKAIGWIKSDNNWYYLTEDNCKMATGWIKDNDIWYYMDKNGAMVKGWKQLNGNWYFLTDSGAMAIGIQKDNSNLYYFKDSGVMATNSGWSKINNKWYYFDKGGKIHNGWVKDNNKWYYLKDDGSMITGTDKIDGTTYMFSDDGVMETGWIKMNNNWYYFNKDGSMATGWADLDGEWYYLDTATGKMITNTTKDGYKIGSDGKRYEAPSQNSPGYGSGNASNQNSPGPSDSGNTSSQYYGIDISNYDGYIDFNSVKSSGVQLAYIKATEGTTFVDPYLKINYDGASAAGLKVGFYHFLVGTSAPETQADNFYNNIKDKKNDLKPMLDVESTGFDVMDYTLRFIAEFKKLSNMDIGIYTYSSFMSNLDGRLSSYPLWEANYNNTPLKNLPTNNIWFSRVGHQYSDTGFVTGIINNTDLDEFTQSIFIK